MKSPQKFLFASSMAAQPWGGSEELWSQTAVKLARLGHHVTASVVPWDPRPKKLVDLELSGVVTKPRIPLNSPTTTSSHRSLIRTLLNTNRIQNTACPFATLLDTDNFDLVIISQGNVMDGLELAERCLERRVPFALLCQANAEFLWPSDYIAERLRTAYRAAKRSYFVSQANAALLMDQLGISLDNFKVVQNPINVSWDAAPTWPSADELNLACVARLEPSAKGQDLLFHVLSEKRWQNRRIKVNLYGKGSAENSLRLLAKRLEIERNINFCGHIDDIESLWSQNHCLVLPSRYEGLPLAACEAMICARPIVATSVAGIPEILVDNHTGYLAAYPTLLALEEAMERMYADRDRLREIGTNARRHYEKIHTPTPVEDFACELSETCKN